MKSLCGIHRLQVIQNWHLGNSSCSTCDCGKQLLLVIHPVFIRRIPLQINKSSLRNIITQMVLEMLFPQTCDYSVVSVYLKILSSVPKWAPQGPSLRKRLLTLQTHPAGLAPACHLPCDHLCRPFHTLGPESGRQPTLASFLPVSSGLCGFLGKLCNQREIHQFIPSMFKAPTARCSSEDWGVASSQQSDLCSLGTRGSVQLARKLFLSCLVTFWSLLSIINDGI